MSGKGMRKIHNMLKIALVNVLLIASIVGLVVLIPVASQVGYSIISRITPGSESATRAALPNYADTQWAHQHFDDMRGLTTVYRDFVVWEAKPYESETINIGQDGLRHVVQSSNVTRDEAWLFGGSTMWGYGSNDINTIPSILSEITNLRVTNYSLVGYHARQSVNKLISAYSDLTQSNDRNRIVIFYDGVNDVLDKCQAENSGSGTAREQQIRATVDLDDLSPLVAVRPALALIERIDNALDKSLMNSEYVCSEDPGRSEKIAQALVNDWVSADAIARVNGDRFIAILQPVAYLSNTRLEHLGADSKEWKKVARQYQAIYPAIRRSAGEAGIEFVDLTHIHDYDEFIYIDFCHTSPNGNRTVAVAIAKLLT